MTAPVIQANYEQLEQVAARFGRATETQHRLMRTVRDHADVLVRGSWEGEGVSAFARELDGEVMPAMQRLAEALREAQRVTGDVAATVRSAEEEAARLFYTQGTGTLLPGGIYGGGGAGGGDGFNDAGSPESLASSEGPIREPGVHETAEMDGLSGKDWGSPREDDFTDFSAVVHKDDLFNVGDSVWSDSYDLGRFGKVDLDIGGYEADASYSIGFDDDGFEIDGDFNADAHLVQVEYGGRYGNVDIGAEAQVGFESYAGGQIEINPLEGDLELEAGGEAFVGASVEGDLNADLHYGNVGATGKVGYGVGAEGHFDVGLDDWVFDFDAGASLFVGIGGGGGLKFEVDIPQIIDDGIIVGGSIVDRIGSSVY
ncbi:MAG: WXG100 family type VII secretion target [Caldilineaceae bacterium]|nr:WXG100 family type VII secretion target [Caldilineaceae bacterium]